MILKIIQKHQFIALFWGTFTTKRTLSPGGFRANLMKQNPLYIWKLVLQTILHFSQCNQLWLNKTVAVVNSGPKIHARMPSGLKWAPAWYMKPSVHFPLTQWCVRLTRSGFPFFFCRKWAKLYIWCYATSPSVNYTIQAKRPYFTLSAFSGPEVGIIK